MSDLPSRQPRSTIGAVLGSFLMLAAGVAHAQPPAEALAKLLETYDRQPSPKGLLDIARALRELGRIADAANTYQRYLGSSTSADVGEVKQQLTALDEQLTVLTVRVSPRGSDVSIDGGPFVTVGGSLQTRVRPGIHLIRIRKGPRTSELTINGFEGEAKDVSAALPGDAADLPGGGDAPDHVDGWLITGTQYSAQRVHTAHSELAAIAPHDEAGTAGEAPVPDAEPEHISSGVVALVRVDLAGRCCAGGLGLALTVRDPLDFDVAVLRSSEWGVYLGVRYRILTGRVRPYLAAGAPLFAFTKDTSTAIAPGLRAAAGVEIAINPHVSLTADLGVEHFFNVDDTTFDATVWVPTLGAIGRL